MRLCSGHNFTFLIVNLIAQNDIWFVDKNENWPKGAYAEYMLKLLLLDDIETLKKSARCFFLWTETTGTYFPLNNSYNGAIGLIIDSKADFFIRPLDYYSVNPELVGFSRIISALGHFSLQLINKKLNNENDKNSKIDFLIPPLNFTIITLICLIICFVFLLFDLDFKPSNISRIQKKVHFKLFAFFCILFGFLIGNLYNGNLNTTSVIVNVDDLLYSKDKLLETKKEFCFLEKTAMNDYFENSSKSSLVYRIYEKRNKTNPCLCSVNEQIGNVFDRDLTNIFLLIPDFDVLIISRYLQTFFKKNTFVNDQQIYEILSTLIYSKTLDEKILNFLNRWVDSFMMFGFLKKESRNMPNNLEIDLVKTIGKGAFRTYTNLQDYIEDHTFIGPLSFDKLNYFFKIYFILQILIVYLSLIHYFSIKLFFGKNRIVLIG